MRGGAGAVVVAVACALIAPASASATHTLGCGLLGLLPCEHPPGAVPPDPGGEEVPDQPVPYPDKGFGFNSNMALNATATPEQEVDAVAEAGGKYLRLGLRWAALQKEQDYPDVPSSDNLYVRRLQDLYDAAEARGVKLVLITWWAPLWATRYQTCGLLDLECHRIRENIVRSRVIPFPDPSHLPDYRDWVKGVKTRFPKALIEPWNEPNYYWGKQSWVATPDEFKAIQCAAHDASKAVNNDPVLAAGWAENSYEQYVGGVYAAGGKNCWDLANAHLYYGKALDHDADWSPMAVQLDYIRRTRAAHGDTDPIWVTETGYTTTGSGRVSEPNQADGLRRTYNRLVTMPDVDGVFVHTTRDDQFDNESPAGTEYGYGLLRKDWTPKPAFCAFAARSGGSYPGC